MTVEEEKMIKMRCRDESKKRKRRETRTKCDFRFIEVAPRSRTTIEARKKHVEWKGEGRVLLN